MDKIFQLNKWFVLFCGLLVVVYVSLQYVINTELTTLGQEYGTEVFTWEWPDGKDRYLSNAVLKAHVLKRNEGDAIVEVTGRQRLETRSDDGKIVGEAQNQDCHALLTLYKSGKAWLLGKVEIK
ncbi:MAG TPA: hypothetical protein V6C72_00705 [Chroococcales cyanobacterium]